MILCLCARRAICVFSVCCKKNSAIRPEDGAPILTAFSIRVSLLSDYSKFHTLERCLKWFVLLVGIPTDSR